MRSQLNDKGDKLLYEESDRSYKRYKLGKSASSAMASSASNGNLKLIILLCYFLNLLKNIIFIFKIHLKLTK